MNYDNRISNTSTDMLQRPRVLNRPIALSDKSDSLLHDAVRYYLQGPSQTQVHDALIRQRRPRKLVITDQHKHEFMTRYVANNVREILVDPTTKAVVNGGDCAAAVKCPRRTAEKPQCHTSRQSNRNVKHKRAAVTVTAQRRL